MCSRVLIYVECSELQLHNIMLAVANGINVLSIIDIFAQHQKTDSLPK